jgi:type I restriction-modification system DNA methylase subunit
MLTIAKEHITAGEQREGKRLGRAVNAEADIHLFGQEVNPETFAVCKSDLFMKSEKGEDAERIAFGSTLSKDRHAAVGFDYLIANPPFYEVSLVNLHSAPAREVFRIFRCA